MKPFRLLLPLLLLLALLPVGRLAPTAQARAVSRPLWVPNGRVSALQVAGGTLYVGGSFSNLAPFTGHFASLDPASAAPDAAFPTFNRTVRAVADDGAGGWYVAGDFTAVSDTPRARLAHIRANRTLDLLWSPDISFPDLGLNRVSALVRYGDTVYLGGSFDRVDGHVFDSVTGLVAVDAVTGALRGWYAGGTVSTLKLSGSTLYIGGSFESVGSAARKNLAALDLATRTVTSWSLAIDGPVYDMVVDGGTVYISGAFSKVGGQPHAGIAALDAASGAVRSWSPPGNGKVLAAAGANLYVSGSFSISNGLTRQGLVALDKITGAVQPWDPNVLGSVEAMVAGGNTLYIGGNFWSVGGEPRQNLAAVDSATGAVTAWNPRPNGLLHMNGSVNATVRILAILGDRIYAGGDFYSFGGVARDNIAAIDLATGAPTGWSPSITGLPGEVSSLAVSGNAVYIAGIFNKVGDQDRDNIAAIDATTGTTLAWNPQHDPSYYSMSILEARDGLVYLGGAFSSIGGQQRNNLAAVDGINGTPTTWKPDPNNTVKAIVFSGSTIYVGGKFDTVGGQPRNGAAAFDAATGALKPWTAQLDLHSAVNGLAFRQNTLHVAGEFSIDSQQQRCGLAAFDATTGALDGWNPKRDPGFCNADDGYVDFIARGGGDIFVGGSFRRAGGQPRAGLAGLDPTTGAATWWKPSADLPAPSALTIEGDTLFAGFADDPGLAAIKLAPIAITVPVTRLTATSARLNGRALAGASDATVAFEITTTSGDYSQAIRVPVTPDLLPASGALEFGADAPGLTPYRRYFYRAVLTDASGTLAGEEQPFIAQNPVVVPLALR